MVGSFGGWRIRLIEFHDVALWTSASFRSDAPYTSAHALASLFAIVGSVAFTVISIESPVAAGSTVDELRSSSGDIPEPLTWVKGGG